MAVEQHDKIRLVLNVSLPENLLFNANIADVKLEKVRMSSDRQFGIILLKSFYIKTFFIWHFFMMNFFV